MVAKKTVETDELRQAILADSETLVETERADRMTVTLSFKSLVKPERHVWIDTCLDQEGFAVSLDLEDWTNERSWDNAVATVETKDIDTASEVARMWLRGEELESCLRKCTNCKVELK